MKKHTCDELGLIAPCALECGGKEIWRRESENYGDYSLKELMKSSTISETLSGFSTAMK